MERPNILSILKTRVISLQTADSENVYVHRALIDKEVTGVGGCGWSCFPSDTVSNFVEYLYQGDYTTPAAAVVAGSDAPMGSYTLVPTGILSLEQSFRSPNAITLAARESLDYEKVFLTHAGLFILSRRRNVLPLSTMSLERLEEAMKEAQGKVKESLFVENMRALIQYSYNPCCSGNKGAWEELQKTLSRFLVSKKGWILEEPGSGLIGGEEKLAKDLLAGAINLLIDSDKLLVAAEKQIEDLKLDPKDTGNKLGKKKKSSH
ncbi:hypothetical protein HOY80DRAFT_955384 [Tuber brumale]|nr:hypothetical protein HOY80DRAFT_955384 [Tuber brumale]